MVFAAYYVGEANFNATRAAELTGIVAKDRHSLNSIASSLLARPEVQQYIRTHVESVQITQTELLQELADMARWRWQDNIEDASMTMETAKVFDTMMRGKTKAMSDLLKQFQGDQSKELENLRKAIEQHKLDVPNISAEDRANLFKEHVDHKMVDQVMADLLKADENKRQMSGEEVVQEEGKERKR
jgi:phage terminase small subunit